MEKENFQQEKPKPLFSEVVYPPDVRYPPPQNQVKQKNRNSECVRCKLQFKTEYDLDKHVNNVHVVHTRDEYNCVKCHSKFRNQHFLRKHIEQVHFEYPGSRLDCEMC